MRKSDLRPARARAMLYLKTPVSAKRSRRDTWSNYTLVSPHVSLCTAARADSFKCERSVDNLQMTWLLIGFRNRQVDSERMSDILHEQLSQIIIDTEN